MDKKSIKEIPFEFRKEIYEKLVECSKEEDFKKTGLYTIVDLPNGNGQFQLVLSTEKLIHILVRLGSFQIETGAELEDKIMVFCIEKDNLESLIN